MGEMPALVLHKDSAFFLERLTKSLTEVSFHCERKRSNDATTYDPALAAHGVRVLQLAPPSYRSEGTGKAGYLLIPMARVRKKMHAAVTTGLSQMLRPSLRDGFNGCFMLSPGTGFLAPVATTRVPRVAQTSAPGCQNHMT